MIATTDAGPVNPRLTSSRSGCTVDAAPGGEPTSSILSRTRPALDAWAEQAQACDHTLIVVTHDAEIRPLLINIAPALPLPNVPTGSYQLLRRHSKTWRIGADQLP
jgi:broad specificity phosphatase PhoE